MSAKPQKAMTVDEFLAWSVTAPGRYELVHGEVIAMTPERIGHSRTKFAVQSALEKAISVRKLQCRMVPDGATVRIDPKTAYEPDALVYCGAPLSDNAIEVPSPVIVVEVLSPGTAGHDTGEKLVGYFRLASVLHYLIVDPVRRVIVHHRRNDTVIETRILSGGILSLSPPGLELSVVEFFPPG